MKIKSITLDDREVPYPKTVTVELSLAEAQWIATATGRLSPRVAEETYGELGEVCRDLYRGLTGNLFNRFWDAGLEGVGREENE